ncbi:MAG: hypothetical protein JXQ96_12500 [Cyclobacteriaceae bacterium]
MEIDKMNLFITISTTIVVVFIIAVILMLRNTKKKRGYYIYGAEQFNAFFEKFQLKEMTAIEKVSIKDIGGSTTDWYQGSMLINEYGILIKENSAIRDMDSTFIMFDSKYFAELDPSSNDYIIGYKFQGEKIIIYGMEEDIGKSKYRLEMSDMNERDTQKVRSFLEKYAIKE